MNEVVLVDAGDGRKLVKKWSEDGERRLYGWDGAFVGRFHIAAINFCAARRLPAVFTDGMGRVCGVYEDPSFAMIGGATLYIDREGVPHVVAEEMRIVCRDEGGFAVLVGDRECDHLTYDEMLGLVASTFSNHARCYQWLRTREESRVRDAALRDSAAERAESCVDDAVVPQVDPAKPEECDAVVASDAQAAAKSWDDQREYLARKIMDDREKAKQQRRPQRFG